MTYGIKKVLNFINAKKEGGGDQEALQNALSCYYSGNFTRGFKKEKDGKSYVDRVNSKVKESYIVPSLHVKNESDIQSIKQPEKSQKSWDVFGDY